MIIYDELTIEEFNFFFDTLLNQDMSFDEAVKEIEDQKNKYFYVSMAKEDIEDALSNEDESLIKALELWNIYITNLGIYISMQQ